MITPPTPTVAVPLFGASVIVTLLVSILFCGSVSFANTEITATESSSTETVSKLAEGEQS